MSCIKSLPEICRLGIARVGIRTLLLVLFTCVTQHTAVLLGNSSTLNKRGENPPRYNRTTPADFSLANPAVNAQTIFSFSAVMAFHEALKTEYDSKTSPCSSHYEQVKGAWSSSIATTARENNGTLVRLGLKPRDDAPTSMGRG